MFSWTDPRETTISGVFYEERGLVERVFYDRRSTAMSTKEITAQIERARREGDWGMVELLTQTLEVLRGHET